MPESKSQSLGAEVQPSLPPLPFTYERTYDRDKAEIDTYRVNPWRFAGSTGLRTDSDILKLVDKSKRNQEWFTYDEWRRKGSPIEQVEFTLGKWRLLVYLHRGFLKQLRI